MKKLFLPLLTIFSVVPAFASISTADISAYYKFENDIVDETGNYNLVDTGHAVSYVSGKKDTGVSTTGTSYASRSTYLS